MIARGPPGMTLALALAVGASAEAAERGEKLEDVVEVPISELLELETVTPSLETQTLGDSPASVYVVTAETMKRRGYRNLEELLDDVPGVEIQRKAGVEYWNLFSLRGIRGNAKFVVLLDGFRVNAASGTPHSYGPNFSLVNAKRVEVVLGPVSAVYGADAFSGVVNVITRDGAETSGATVTGSFGRFETTDDSFAVGGRLGEVSLSLSGSLYASKEPDLPRYYPREYAWYFDRYLPEGKARASPFGDEAEVVDVPVESFSAPSRAHFLHGRLDVGRFHLGFVRHGHAFSSSTGAKPEFSLSIPSARWEYAIHTAYAQHLYRSPTGRVGLESSLSASSYEVLPHSRYVNSFNGYGGYKYEQWLSVLGEERLHYRFADWLSGSFGLSFADLSGQPKSADLTTPFDTTVSSDSQAHFYRGSEVTDATGRSLAEPIDFFHVRQQNIGSFAELRAHPWESVSATAGARYDHNTRYGESFSPRVGVTLRPLAKTSVRLLYGQAFLAPAPYEAYQHFGAFEPDVNGDGDVVGLRSGFWFLPNPHLRPERLNTVEAGISQSVGDLLHLAVDGYRTGLTGLIRSVDEGPGTFKGWPVDAISRHHNQLDGRAWGGSLRATGDFKIREVRLYPSASWALSRGDVGGVPLAMSSPHVLRFGLDLRWRKLSTSARVQWRSAAIHPTVEPDGTRAVVPASVSDALSVRLSEIASPGGLTLSPWLKTTNLFDRRYGHVSLALDQFRAAPQDPLRVLFGVDVEGF